MTINAPTVLVHVSMGSRIYWITGGLTVHYNCVLPYVNNVKLILSSAIYKKNIRSYNRNRITTIEIKKWLLLLHFLLSKKCGFAMRLSQLPLARKFIIYSRISQLVRKPCLQSQSWLSEFYSLAVLFNATSTLMQPVRPVTLSYWRLERECRWKLWENFSKFCKMYYSRDIEQEKVSNVTECDRQHILYMCMYDVLYNKVYNVHNTST
jgi:hypothetical protein